MFIERKRQVLSNRGIVFQMETEVRTLKQELVRTREALRAATKKCCDLVRELDNRTTSHESERSLRDQQLSRILRALLVLEARLKQEQKSIRQLLCEKDNVIRNQQLEIARLRRYTKNYIKCKREQTLGRSSIKVVENSATDIENNDLQTSNVDVSFQSIVFSSPSMLNCIDNCIDTRFTLSPRRICLFASIFVKRGNLNLNHNLIYTVSFFPF